MSGRYLFSSILLAFAVLIMPAAMSGAPAAEAKQQDVQLQAAQKKIAEEKESENLRSWKRISKACLKLWAVRL